MTRSIYKVARRYAGKISRGKRVGVQAIKSECEHSGFDLDRFNKLVKEYVLIEEEKKKW